MTPEQITKQHNDAMLLSEQADTALQVARNQYAVAAQMDLECALACGDVEPSRSVLLRSAGTLYYNARKFEAAEDVLRIAIDGKGPEEIKQECRDVLEWIKRNAK